MYSNKIDLEKVFKNFPVSYVAVRLSDYYPNYYTYSDIDIFCDDKQRFSDELNRRLLSLKENIYTRTIKNRIHVDYYPIGAPILDFKFDIFDDFYLYKKLQVISGLKKAVLHSSCILRNRNVRVPSKLYEGLFRLLEYYEYIDERPDKTKHLNFLLKNYKEKELLYISDLICNKRGVNIRRLLNVTCD